MTDERPHGKVQVRCAGLSYTGLVYWAKDSVGKPSLVIALPMGADMPQLQAMMDNVAGGAVTAEDGLDWLVERIATHGAEVLPWVDEPAPRAN